MCSPKTYALAISLASRLHNMPNTRLSYSCYPWLQIRDIAPPSGVRAAMELQVMPAATLGPALLCLCQYIDMLTEAVTASAAPSCLHLLSLVRATRQSITVA